MAWHLKDRELEKKLIEIAPDFVESLNESLKLGEYEENSWTYRVWFGPYEDCYKFEMHVYDDELEEVPEYNPKTWNSYPEVIPPQGAMMRIKYHDVTSKDRKVERGFALFDCGQWVSDSGYPKFPNSPQNYVIWFRPWIGPDEEGEE